MSAVNAVTNTMRGKQTFNPKTVLGFYATVLGVVLAATLGVVGVLAANNVETRLIPWLLGFDAVLIVLMLGGVFLVSLKDPSRLMLTQVTGTEYAQIQTLILGDSSSGERLELVPISDNRVAGAEETTETVNSAEAL